MVADTPATPSRPRLHAAASAEEARAKSLRAHPSSRAPKTPRPPAAPPELDALPRWERLRLVLVDQGLSDEEARTEVARIAAGEVCDRLADELRQHRAAGRQTDANVVAVGLRSIQGVTLPILRHPGDVVVARSSLSRAQRRLHHNRGVLDLLHERSHALRRAEEAFRILEAFLRPL